YNGTSQQRPAGGGGGPGAFFQQLQAQQANLPRNPAENRIRVVADTGTNSLLIKANPLDMFEIRALLGKIDVSEEALIKRFTVKLKNANANAVADVIRDVYREYMNNNPRGSSFGFGGGFRFGGGGGGPNRNIDGYGNPRAIMLSVGVVEQTNELVLS